MAVALECGIGDLLAEFLAHAFVILRFLQTARTVASCAFETLFDGLDDFGVRIEGDFHLNSFRL